MESTLFQNIYHYCSSSSSIPALPTPSGEVIDPYPWCSIGHLSNRGTHWWDSDWETAPSKSHFGSKEKPPEPRYEETWDVNLILNYIREKWPNNGQLSTLNLRRKCVVLGRLATIARSSDLHRIKFSSIHFNNRRMTYATKPLKNHTRVALSGLVLDELSTETSLCPVQAWQAYLDQTKHIPRNQDCVFVSAKAPHKELSVDTLAKDTLFVMKEAGIDVNRYKAHSTRAVAASRAIDAGATVDNVMRWGRWKSHCVFMRFYNRSTKRENFTKLILSQQNDNTTHTTPPMAGTMDEFSAI